MFIFVGCAGGGTSSIFCQKIVKEINGTDSNLTAAFDHFETIMKKQRGYGEAYDLVFAYGGMDALKGYNAFEFGKLFDVVLVAPQVRYLLPEKQQLLRNYPTIVREIAPQVFGYMDGAKAYRLLLDDLIALDDERAYRSSILDPTKAADKNLEIFVLAGERNNSALMRLREHWQQMGLRILQQAYQLETLYDFEPEADFDIRLIFGASDAFSKVDLPKIARRIDGVIAAPIAKGKIKQVSSWLKEYQIPVYQMADEEYYDLRGQADLGLLDNFLTTVAVASEFTTEIAVAALEVEKLKPRKKILFGLISWDS